MNVKLRRLKSNDASEVALYLQDSNMNRYLSERIPSPYSLRDAERFVRQASIRFPFFSAIEYKKNLAGVISVKKLDDVFSMNMEIGYWVAKPFQGNGIAKQAVRLMTRTVFKMDNINRVFANVIEDNVASIGVLEGCGYQVEGKFHESIAKNGKIFDCLVLACNKSNWQEWDESTSEFEILYFNKMY